MYDTSPLGCTYASLLRVLSNHSIQHFHHLVISSWHLIIVTFCKRELLYQRLMYDTSPLGCTYASLLRVLSNHSIQHFHHLVNSSWHFIWHFVSVSYCINDYCTTPPLGCTYASLLHVLSNHSVQHFHHMTWNFHQFIMTFCERELLYQRLLYDTSPPGCTYASLLRVLSNHSIQHFHQLVISSTFHRDILWAWVIVLTNNVQHHR